MSGKKIISKKERAVAFIVARLSSSRLPEKQFRKIGPKTLLDWILDELKRCRELDEIVLATTNEPENEPLVSWCKANGIPCFSYEGDINHVTTRLRRAAERFSADICVLISGDCPLIYAPVIDQLIVELKQNPDVDVVKISPDSKGHLPAVQGVGVARKRAWQLADDLSNSDQLKEHQFPIIYQRPDIFNIYWIGLDNGLYDPFDHRYSVDTWADLEFQNALHNTLLEKGHSYRLPDVITLLRENKYLLSINRHVHQKGVDERAKNVLMIVDAGNGYGYGHLMRSRELALQITERLAWPVTFMVADERAMQILSAVGIRVITPHDETKGQGGRLERYGKSEGATSQGLLDPQVIKALDSFDLIILDIYYQRYLPSGWRTMFSKECKVVVLDRLEEWSKEADLIVVPGVTYNEKVDFQSGDWPEVLTGIDYVILRREIRRVQAHEIPKDIDVLAYLHLEDQRNALKELNGRNGLKVHVIDGFEQDFPGLLARSRIFLSGFGISFYEALALGSYPVTWALSDTHSDDAKRFYQRIGLKALIIDAACQLDEVYKVVKETQDQGKITRIEDGTHRIVEKIYSLI